MIRSLENLGREYHTRHMGYGIANARQLLFGNTPHACRSIYAYLWHKRSAGFDLNADDWNARRVLENAVAENTARSRFAADDALGLVRPYG